MMCGVRYASAVAVKPRGTIFTICMTSEDRLTCTGRDSGDSSEN